MATVKTAQGTVTFVDLQDGTSRVTLQYFYKTSADASEPTVPQGDFEYDFLSGVLTASASTAFDNWSTIPDSLSFSEALWMVSITLEGPVGSTATFNQGNWNGPVVLSRVGFQPTQPDPATSVATVFIFKAGASNTTAPTGNPSGDFTFTYATGDLSGGDLNGWSQDLPTVAPGNYVWVKQATASSTSATDTIPASEFNASAATVLSGTGLDGYNNAVVQLYNKNSDASSAPADPSGDFKYIFPSGLLTPESGAEFNGWTQSAPSITNGEYLWIIQGSAVGRGDTDLIKGAEFGDAQIVGVGGENAEPPGVSTVRDDATGITTVTIGDTSFPITDGDNGTSEGVTVIYANDSSGDGKDTVRRTGQEYVLYYEWVGIENKPNSNLTNLINEDDLEWIKFVGETPDAQGIVPVYSSVQDPSDMSTISLDLVAQKFVTFYEWTGTRPTQDDQLDSDLHLQTFVPFVGSNGDPAGRYSTFRAYSTTSTTPPSGTITWATGAVELDDTTNWSLSAPEVAVSPSTTVYWSDLVFVDADGDAEYTTVTGSAAKSLISFNGVVTFSSTTAGSITLNNDGTAIPVLDAASVGSAGSTVIHGGRIKTNTIKLSSVENSVENSDGETSGDQSGMILSDDTITIQDSAGLTRIFIGKLS